ncbi:MAG: 23S rRNA (adenine(2503)-C(2))-methyltransferase RlmN, partial [Deltaproteobacteria bacterium]
APRRVTVSTSGIVPMIERLGKETKVNLAVSINAATDETRNRLMPINKKYPLKALLYICKKYPAARNRHITFEYVLIAGVNDSIEDAKRLAGLLKGIRCKINLIPFNPFAGTKFKRPSDKVVSIFHKILLDNHYTSIVRASKGQDISAACGQLKGRLK